MLECVNEGWLTVTDDIAIPVFADLAQRRPFGMVFEIVSEIICLYQSVQVVFRQFI